MSDSPIDIFDSAHKRALAFLEVGKSGPKSKDNLRAAVVFAVAAVDTFFRVKIIKYLKEQREKRDSTFKMSPAAQKLVREILSKKSFRKEYRDITKTDKDMVDVFVASSNSKLISHLEDALEQESFQGIDKISDAFKIMDKNPPEIWGKFDASTKLKKPKRKKGPGRPFKSKLGKKIDAKTQMERMFKKRHFIAHQADVVISGKKLVGKLRKIEYSTVRRWLEHSRKAIHEINKLIA
ncbi:hypothetical protein A3A39_01900 [Candidatus Kaiserbacteria bacterium RIFCSPLOWO2_01_FULL_54_13]|uniref:RiboL-PSP-HEPN domain-containing protein n=1 Tax=Candidatus Kaiserbacteria bacterium RIFCSPLOWO2_01_FULL_54_13 TaxID=1798512 RepID=A0A1F6F0E1_9BACT|nr:MAG: hypothetical protein A3A39_01900 [Candidatus Kaiserbacteria bacterium RIFCSPLOWO2_01_FULL_54_13]